MRAVKDIVKRLRFELVPRPDAFRRLYFVVAAAAVLLTVGLWALLAGRLGERQYLPGPVTASHASFGDRCEACHESFAGVPDRACLECHAKRIHSEHETRTPACRDCHVEHRGESLLLISLPAACVDCHGELESKRSEPAIERTIRGFADHPEFVPLREGKKDRAALRFNHRLHLTSGKIDEADRLACPSCHRVEADGRTMAPIVFESHCRRCHEQKVKEAPAPIGEIEARHAAPAEVREGLIADLLVLAVLRPDELFEAPDILLPGRAARDAVDQSRSLREYQEKWLGRLEENLYQPFTDAKPLLEHNKYCFLCHEPDEEKAEGDLPGIRKTEMPHRWLGRGEFSHRRHDKLDCRSCHVSVAESEATSDTNLPGREACLHCHVDRAAESAGTNCILCHLYHDTSKDPSRRKPEAGRLSIEVLTGKAPPPGASEEARSP